MNALIGRPDHGQPQVWAGALAAYNNGDLHGAWIDVTSDLDEVMAAVQEVLSTSPVKGEEEWDVMDTSNVVEGFRCSVEGAVLSVGICEALKDAGQSDPRGLLGAYVDWQGADTLTDPHDAAEEILDKLLGKYENLRHYADEVAAEVLEQQGITDGHFAYRFFNWASHAHDMDCNGDVHVSDEGYVFDCH